MSVDNFVQQIGRLTRDPESRQAGNGNVVHIGLAVDRSYKKDGEWINRAVFTDWQAWNGVGHSIMDRAKKGDLVLFQGEYNLEEWNDQEGNPRKTPRFTVLNWKFLNKVGGGTPKETGESSDNTPAAPTEPKKRGRPSNKGTNITPPQPVAKAENPSQSDDDDDSEIPF